VADVRRLLLDGLTEEQVAAVSSDARRLLVVAGAGSGKTEIMARRVAWWVRVEGVPKSAIVAFTFTRKGAEEMKFRIRKWLQVSAPEGSDVTLGDMYVGTIHSFCVDTLRLLDPSTYSNYDVLEDAARNALIQRHYWDLGLEDLRSAAGLGQFATIDLFTLSYDLLHEFDAFSIRLKEGKPPSRPGEEEREWCRDAELLTDVGESDEAEAFAKAASRYYALLCCRRFLDFSTSQTECLRLLKNDAFLEAAQSRWSHLVVDEVQDVNEVQDRLVRTLVGSVGRLTAVGDHRQAIFGWRGGSVDLMARLDEELRQDSLGETINLSRNFRSTPRIIDVSNRWAATIGRLRSMDTPPMVHGRIGREDERVGDVAALVFPNRSEEAEWIADAIERLCPDGRMGAAHDSSGGERGISYADIAVLLRASTAARTYMDALERRGIPAVFRAGPDLFSQPEVLLFLAILGLAAGDEEWVGLPRANRMPNRVRDSLGCGPQFGEVVPAACAHLRADGLALSSTVEDRLLLAARLVHRRLDSDDRIGRSEVQALHTPGLRDWLTSGGRVRRVFPQQLYHFILAEAGIGDWDGESARQQSVLFHLGQLSTLITGVETPGWVEAGQFKYQVRALALWGSGNARVEEAPLLAQPEAVTITTIHSAKGTEFAAVFLADVVSRRFPSSYARKVSRVAYKGDALECADPATLADNDHLDDERRLMYVALTRAERYLFVTSSSPSDFFRDVQAYVEAAGGTIDPSEALQDLRHAERRYEKELRLVSSFSELRYYLECPHDFFLRKVLGFAPTIDQAFGYGRGVHNLMREVHSNPEKWAALAGDEVGLRERLRELAEGGGFYLRYTTGDPLRRMRAKAVEIVARYVERYGDELSRLEFEPERAFETLIEEADTLISGAMDVIRLDDPPRVTLIDFKSGEPASDLAMKLDEDEMKLQVMLYGLAARHELEYEPDLGVVRYLDAADDGRDELQIPLDAATLERARAVVVETANAIRERRFGEGPKKGPRTEGLAVRCQECDFGSFCEHSEAARCRADGTG